MITEAADHFVQENVLKDPIVIKFKETIRKLEVPVHSIYFFGSRAKGSSKDDSDYDFLVLLYDVQDKERLKEIRGKIILGIHDDILNTNFDIMIRNLSIFEENKNIMNTIYNNIYEEGFLI